MDDSNVFTEIGKLVEEEHDLRSGADDIGPSARSDTASKLKRIEQDLDRCWDLLRQRRARREFGQNPKEAQVRPAGQVQGYKQ
ncbi:DUF2630 family protein [uncultured Arthrobacter sp.]|uniref:DUF2630 family protein n=1 Tax=uncultured Arthrobacter sp. TaxID=114050 RepID=UPI0025E4605F|nr:DUF2630 family protein [uncultured Arthrobacter sp.]